MELHTERPTLRHAALRWSRCRKNALRATYEHSDDDAPDGGSVTFRWERKYHEPLDGEGGVQGTWMLEGSPCVASGGACNIFQNSVASCATTVMAHLPHELGFSPTRLGGETCSVYPCGESDIAGGEVRVTMTPFRHSDDGHAGLSGLPSVAVFNFNGAHDATSVLLLGPCLLGWFFARNKYTPAAADNPTWLRWRDYGERGSEGSDERGGTGSECKGVHLPAPLIISAPHAHTHDRTTHAAFTHARRTLAHTPHAMT
jgi:hypothetical protein